MIGTLANNLWIAIWGIMLGWTCTYVYFKFKTGNTRKVKNDTRLH